MNRSPELTQALTDLAGRADADQPGDRLYRIHRRARRAAAARIVGSTAVAVVGLTVAATVVTHVHGSPAAQPPGSRPTSTLNQVTHTPSPAPTSTGPAAHQSPSRPAVNGSMCLTSSLTARLGTSQGAAGSIYQAIVFTNTSKTTCTMFGYPGVSYVAPGTGHQVGAAAARNPAHPSVTVTLAPGGSASALVQMVDALNYPPSSCALVSVSGLRIYPPGNTAATYLPFAAVRKACSTQVSQLTVEASVPGVNGQ